MRNLLDRYRQSINPPYNFKDYLNLALTFLILLGLPVAVYLAQQPQELRQRAQEAQPQNARQGYYVLTGRDIMKRVGN